jgi:hypothetical protein
MRNLRAVLCALIPLFPTGALAQTTTTTILVNYEPLNGACGAHFKGEISAYFNDTVGRNWDYLTIRLQLQKTNAETGSTAPTPVVSVAINGVFVGNPVFVTNQSFCWDNLQTYEFGTNFLQGYNAFGQNKLTVYSSNGWAGGPPAELIFTTEQRKFAFDLVPAMSEKMLIHNSRTDHPDPSPWQLPTADTERPRFRFRGAISARSGSPESDVWLRVVDPADPSPYLPPGLSFPDDNRDPMPKGTLMTSGCTDPTCRAAPGAPLQVHSSPGGVVQLELEGTDRYAGDNYQLEASFDPQFTCATAGANGANLCARSGTVTAWKRIYVEKMRMLRNGMLLDQPAAAGDTSVVVRGNRYRGNAGHHRVSRGDRVVLVHAPQLDKSDVSAGWYSEVHTVLGATDRGDGTFLVEFGTRNGQTNTREPLSGAYRPDDKDAFIGDSMALIAGTTITADDGFDARDDLVTGSVFPEAFTEYVYLIGASNSNTPLPHLNSGGNDEDTLQRLADKWSSVTGWNGTRGVPAPNHQLLIIGDLRQGATGLTISQVSGETASFVFRGTIEDQVHHAADADRWAMKTCAHELAHQWNTNNTIWAGAELEHCPETTKVYNDPAIYCLLASYNATGAGAPAERMNGIARFHMLANPRNPGDWHSEYFGIRRRVDPFLP